MSAVGLSNLLKKLYETNTLVSIGTALKKTGIA